MKNLLLKGLVAVTILSSTAVMSQEVENNETINVSRSVTSFDSTSKKLVGSSYIQKEFLPAKVIESDKTYAARFNVYQDEMEIKKDGEDYTLPKTSNYSLVFQGTNKTYRVYKYMFENTEKPGFFVELFKGDKIILLLKERIILQEEVKPSTGYEKYKPPTLKHVKDKLYIGYKNNTTAEVPSKKKEFFNLFSSKAGEVEKFAKSNRLGIKDADDVTKIFSYYNSLK